MRNINSLVGLSPELRAVLAGTGVSGLPPIRGDWKIVDPYKVTESAGGIEGAFASILDAYNACVSGRGDGILVLSGGLTTANTTSYLPASLTWDKWGITVVGVAAGQGYNSRARISNLAATTASTTMSTPSTSTILRTTGSFITDGWIIGSRGTVACTGANDTQVFTVSAVTETLLTCSTTTFTAGQTAANMASTVLTPYLVNMMTISGQNNAFYNLMVVNGCLSTLALGAVSVTGANNYFCNCHFSVGQNTSRTGQVADYDLTLNASQNTFDRCYLGNNNVIRAGAAMGNLVLGVTTTQIGQNFFNDCYFISWSVTTTHGAIKVTDVATLGGWVIFTRCKFINWNNAKTYMATIIIGATPTNWGILLDHCSSVGYTALSANDDMSFVTPYGSAAGAGSLGTSV